MSGRRVPVEYQCSGCGPFGEGHPHTLTVDFHYTSMTVAIERPGKPRVILDWPEWEALLQAAMIEQDG